MKVNCVYRWALNGEIIESHYDTETGLIDGVPEICFRIPDGRPDYHSGNYQLYGAVAYPVLHQYLNKYSKAYAIIDYDGIGIIEVQNDTAYVYLFVDSYLPSIKIPYVFTHNILCAGHARTIIRQFSVYTPPQMLYYDFDMNCFHTAKGDFPADFNVHEIEPIQSFNRYLDMAYNPRGVGVSLIGGANRVLLNDNGVIRKE